MNKKKKTTTEQPVNEKVTNPVPSKEELKDSLLDIYDLVKMFNVKRGTIYNWCNQGELTFIKVGGRRYFDKVLLYKKLEEFKQTVVPGEKNKKS